MYRIAIMLADKKTLGKNFDTRGQADEWLLSMMDKHDIKKFRIKDLDTDTVIEDERGLRNKKEE